MNYSHVVATSRNRVIGKNNGIPWDLPEDRKYFRNLTLNHPIIMGKKTFDSIGKPLPKRTNIIISRNTQKLDGCEVFPSIEEAVTYCNLKFPKEEIFIIGGGEIYSQTLPLISKIYLTLIEQDFEGDVFYPEIPKEFQEISSDNRESPLKYAFKVLEKK